MIKPAFKQAKNEIFASDEFDQIVNDWKKKDMLAANLAEEPNFVNEVKQLAEVKLMSKLKGISNEAETD